MPNSAYWKKRMEALEDMNHKKGRAYTANVEKQFRMAQKNIEDKINYWYARMADNNEITMQGAKRLLRADELEEFKWSVEEYIEKGKTLNYHDTWKKQLENASAKVHINRLEALKMQMQQECEVLYGNMLDGLDGTLRDMYTNSYYHTAYELMKGHGVGWAFNRLDTRRIETAINTLWANDGKRFSDRIWTNKSKLVNELNTVLTQNIIRGESPQRAIQQLSKRLDVSRSNAGRLIMTESAFIHSQAQKDCYKELDVERFQFVATLDSHTSELCQAMDGVIIDMSDYKIGLNVPPLHCYCRSCVIPYYEDNVGMRAARGEDGKTYLVSSDMTYKDWKKSFVDGDGKDDLQAVQKSDKISLQDEITGTNNRIEELKQQFYDVSGEVSYDEFFESFTSIEDGFGDITDEDLPTYNALKEIEQKIKESTSHKSKLLLQKEKRGQLDTGYKGRVPDDEIDKYNAKAREQIIIDTGYSDEDAEKFHDALRKYFGGDYKAILSGENDTAKIIKNGIDRMPAFDGKISRGMIFTNTDVKKFSSLKPGETIPKKGLFESWSSADETAIAYSGISDYYRSSVILECVDNKTGVGVQHISFYGKVEAEVLSSADYEVVEVVIENKYDFLSKHTEYLYRPEVDLEEQGDAMRENIVCRIKVKEKK